MPIFQYQMDKKIDLNKIHCGACETVMKDIDSDSVDCIVTDPPYGMSFMGKDWDKAVPSIEIWQECLRVLKPGAFAFVMCIPRQDCLTRMICRLEDAGFNISFSSLYHCFAQGFPKAASLSKQADKRAGVKREVIGKSDRHSGRIDNSPFHKEGIKDAKSMITVPATPQAKALEGAYAGMQLKPAVEVVIVAMKPIEERAYLDQAMANMHGLTWLDDCRIPFESQKDATFSDRPNVYGKEYTDNYFLGANCKSLIKHNNKGRFPANVLCEDDALDDGHEREGGSYPANSHAETCNVYGKYQDRLNRVARRMPNSSSFSRYFSLDAWFAERIKQLPKEAQKTFPFMIVPKASKSEKDRGCEDLEGVLHFPSNNESGNMLSSGDKKPKKIKGNFHPTCKPIKLMSWLITLASCEGDIVLDPFCGSGTTAIAAKMLGRQYVCIEREENYCEMARKRVNTVSARLDNF